MIQIYRVTVNSRFLGLPMRRTHTIKAARSYYADGRVYLYDRTDQIIGYFPAEVNPTVIVRGR